MHEKLPNSIAKADHASILPPTPCPTTPDSSYKNGISDEVLWFKTANNRLHGLVTISRGVNIQENLTFQQFFPQLMCSYAH